MDTRRLTDELEKLCADTYVKTRVFRIADVRELVAYCKSLRAEAAELARALEKAKAKMWMGNMGQVCSDCRANTFEMSPHSEKCLTREIAELLSRPTVVELRKEKD